jgi:hypothetical protein
VIRSKLVTLMNQAVSACLALSLALGTSWAMAGARAESSAAPAHHASHHAPADTPAPHNHHAGACCDLCVVHCVSHISLSSVETPASPTILVIRVIANPRYRSTPDLRLRHYHPLSQAPPTLLG